MNDERMQSLLDTWYRDRETPRPEVQTSVAQIMANVPRTRQRGRWWPLPTFRRKVQASTATDTTEYRSGPIPAANGHAPTLTGRTRLMFSPVKAIIAGGLVFALGGVFLVAQPFDRPESAVPGAEMTEPPVAVDVMQECANIYVSPIVCTWTASDPRLTGTLTHEWMADVSPPEPDDLYSVGWADATLEGPEGDWTGRLYVVWGAQPASTLFAFLSGDGAYEGWQYVGSAVDDGESPGNAPWYGVAYQGERPPYGPQLIPDAE
jgi:hypothetical protein